MRDEVCKLGSFSPFSSLYSSVTGKSKTKSEASCLYQKPLCAGEIGDAELETHWSFLSLFSFLMSKWKSVREKEKKK